MTRAFVLGNGPSLNLAPLDRLRGEFVIGMNRLDLMRLEFDPQWWILVDVRNEDGWWDWPKMLAKKSMFVFRDHDRPFIEPYHPSNVIFAPRCTHIGGDYIPKSWHLPTPCEYGGSMSMALQVAAILGKNPIYLLGADLYHYRGPEAPDLNHFHPDYCRYSPRVKPEDWERLNERLVYSHEVARRSAEAMGITIYNATEGGALEVYPRVSLSEVL